MAKTVPRTGSGIVGEECRMKYFGMPMGMWALFSGSFRTQLSVVFGYDADEARRIAKAA